MMVAPWGDSMKRPIAVIIGLTILFGGATACGSSSKSTHAATSASQAAPGTVTQTASSPTTSCAKAGTRKIPKTRLLADLALTYGAFHRYL